MIGPKSIASKLHLVVKIGFFLVAASALFLSLVPVLPYFRHFWQQYLSFEVRSGPLQMSFSMLHGARAKWSIWAMELVSRTYHAMVLYFLMRILEPAKAGDPFHPKTPVRLRMMGCVVVMGSLLRTYFCAVLLYPWRAAGQGASVSWAIDTDAIFMGIVLVVLAEVFRRGYVLKTESELTV